MRFSLSRLNSRVTITDLSVWLSIGEALLFGTACLVFGIWLAPVGWPSPTRRRSGRDPRRRARVWSPCARSLVGGCRLWGPQPVYPSGCWLRHCCRARRRATSPANARRRRTHTIANGLTRDYRSSLRASKGLDPCPLRRRDIHHRRRASFRFDDVGQSSGFGPADRAHGRGLLRDPRARPCQDGNGDDLSHIWVFRPLESPDSDLVSLGRDVAGRSRHIRFWLGPSCGPKPGRTASPVARCCCLNRGGRSTISGDVVRTCLWFRVRGMPRPGSRTIAVRGLFHELGSRSALRDHAVRPRSSGRLTRALQRDGPRASEGDLGPRDLRGQLHRPDRPGSLGRGDPRVRRGGKCLGCTSPALDAGDTAPPDLGSHVASHFGRSSLGIIATVVWGLTTGHAAIGNTGSPTVTPFNTVWRDSVLMTVAFSGASPPSRSPGSWTGGSLPCRRMSIWGR